MCHMCESVQVPEETSKDNHVKRAATVMLEVLVDRPFPSDSAFLPLSIPSPFPSPNPPTRSPIDDSSPRMIPGFVPLSENEVLLRCVSGLVWCYSKMGISKLGNVLVLLQANWGRYAEIFAKLSQNVLLSIGLNYDNFFDYIVNIHTGELLLLLF